MFREIAERLPQGLPPALPHIGASCFGAMLVFWRKCAGWVCQPFCRRINPGRQDTTSWKMPLQVPQERIQKVLAKDMIEPKRKFTDMTRVWNKIRAKKTGGPGGLLCLTVVQARELRCAPGHLFLACPTALAEKVAGCPASCGSGSAAVGRRIFSAHSFCMCDPSVGTAALQCESVMLNLPPALWALRYTASGQKTAVVDPYVEVRAGAEVFRTPCVHASPAPAWNWDFDLRLPAPLGTPGALNTVKCASSYATPPWLGLCHQRIAKQAVVSALGGRTVSVIPSSLLPLLLVLLLSHVTGRSLLPLLLLLLLLRRDMQATAGAVSLCCGCCRVSVLDARALGDPGFLGEARVDLASLALEPNSPPLNLWLPLKVLPCDRKGPRPLSFFWSWDAKGCTLPLVPFLWHHTDPAGFGVAQCSCEPRKQSQRHLASCSQACGLRCPGSLPAAELTMALSTS